MMQKINRIPGIVDLRRFFNKGEKWGSGLFQLMRLPNSSGHARFIFITPRSLDKRAVVRNRLRRRAREWVRKNISLFTPLERRRQSRQSKGEIADGSVMLPSVRREAPVLTGFTEGDTALICKKEAVTASRQKFYEELAKIFTRAGY